MHYVQSRLQTFTTGVLMGFHVQACASLPVAILTPVTPTEDLKENSKEA